MTFTPENGGDKVVMNVYDFKGPGVALAMYNTDEVRPGSNGGRILGYEVV